MLLTREKGKYAHEQKGKGRRAKRDKVDHDIWNAFPPYHHTARTHGRDETISRLGPLRSSPQPPMISAYH